MKQNQVTTIFSKWLLLLRNSFFLLGKDFGTNGLSGTFNDDVSDFVFFEPLTLFSVMLDICTSGSGEAKGLPRKKTIVYDKQRLSKIIIKVLRC